MENPNSLSNTIDAYEKGLEQSFSGKGLTIKGWIILGCSIIAAVIAIIVFLIFK